jgi:hypothetical protein
MAEASPTSAPAPGGRLAGVALAFAAAAAAACWNPFAAPLGLAVGLCAALLGLRAFRRRRGRRPVALAALVLGAAAAVASAAVLLSSAAAVTSDLPGAPIVQGRGDAEASALLDESARRTEPARRRARAELEKSTGASTPSARPAGSVNEGAGLEPTPAVGAKGDDDEPE